MKDKWEMLKEYIEQLENEEQYKFSEESYGAWNTIIKIQIEMDELESKESDEK